MEQYHSVSEYAKLNGKDTGNVRRLLASGRLPGQKVGNQWIIPKNTPYPVDSRETTGRYRNWRKRIALHKNKDLMNTLTELVNDLYAIYGNMVAQIILYGSYARGTQTDESDVDIAVILSGNPGRELTNAMVKCVSSYEFKCGKVLSVIDVDQEKYNQWKDVLPFYKNIRRDGIVLWQTAV